MGDVSTKRCTATFEFYKDNIVQCSLPCDHYGPHRQAEWEFAWEDIDTKIFSRKEMDALIAECDELKRQLTDSQRRKQEAVQRALEVAITECQRHADFCKDEAHRGGDWNHLIARYEEASYLAKSIRAMKEKCP